MHKKHFAAGAVVLAMLLTMPVSAFAHCTGFGPLTPLPADISCEVCAIEDCTTAGRHSHDGVTYCGYAHADGICNGGCYALCTTEGCTLSGRHSHDGIIYCGQNHENGFCDGSCQQVRAAVGGGHHGRHGHHGHC